MSLSLSPYYGGDKTRNMPNLNSVTAKAANGLFEHHSPSRADNWANMTLTNYVIPSGIQRAALMAIDIAL